MQVGVYLTHAHRVALVAAPRMRSFRAPIAAFAVLVLVVGVRPFRPGSAPGPRTTQLPRRCHRCGCRSGQAASRRHGTVHCRARLNCTRGQPAAARNVSLGAVEKLRAGANNPRSTGVAAASPRPRSAPFPAMPEDKPAARRRHRRVPRRRAAFSSPLSTAIVGDMLFAPVCTLLVPSVLATWIVPQAHGAIRSSMPAPSRGDGPFARCPSADECRAIGEISCGS
jgi:hypothetical protein